MENAEQIIKKHIMQLDREIENLQKLRNELAAKLPTVQKKRPSRTLYNPKSGEYEPY